MPVSRARRRRPPRGYLILEALVGGVLAAGALMGLAVALGQLRLDSITAARDITAAHYVQRELERARALTYAGVAVGTTGPTALTEAGGQYLLTVEVTGGTESTPPLFATPVDYRDVVATVTYRVNASRPERTTTASIRLYEN